MKKQIFFFIGLFIISLMTNIIYANEGLFHHDEVQLAIAIEQTIDTKIITPEVNNRYGTVLIFSIAYYPFQKIPLDKFMIYFNIIIGSLCVMFAAIFIYELTGAELVSIISGVILSTNPLWLSITSHPKEHMLAILFIMLSFIALIKGIKNHNSYLLIAEVLFLISLTIRVDNILLLPFFVMIFYYRKILGKIFNNDYNAVKLDFANDILPFYLTLILGIGLLFLTKIVFLYTVDSHLKIILLIPIIWSLIHSLSYLPTFLLLTGICIWVVYEKYKEITFLLVMSLPTFIFLGLNSNVSIRLLSILMIPAAIMISTAILWIKNLNKTHHILIYTILILLILFLSKAPIDNILDYRNQYSGPKEMALYVGNHTEWNSTIYLSNFDYAPFIKYYANRTAVNDPQADYILLLNQENNDTNLNYMGTVEYEDYHHSELSFEKRNATLWRRI